MRFAICGLLLLISGNVAWAAKKPGVELVQRIYQRCVAPMNFSVITLLKLTRLSLHDVIFSEEKDVRDLAVCTLDNLGFIEKKRFRLGLMRGLVSDLINNQRTVTYIMRRCDSMPVKPGFLKKAFECVRNNIIQKMG